MLTIRDNLDLTGGNPQTQTFTYDALDRLASAVAVNGTNGTYALQNYSYNATTGNLSIRAGVNYTYGDTNHDHAVTQMGSDSYTYDANGNQITRNVSGSSYTLSYDAENRLVGRRRARQVSVSGAATATFVYDGDGNRVKATVGTTTTYVGNYFEWVSSTSNMKKYYYAGATRVAMRTGSSTINFLLGDHSLTKVRDLLGSQAITTDSGGVKSAEVRYYPWGNTRYTSGTTPTSFKFTGQRYESAIGLYFYNARGYDSSAGRFISPDTIIPEQQGVQAWDRYVYVNNSPTCNVDPSGHWGFDFNLSSIVNSVFNSVGLNSTDVINGLNTASTILDVAGLVIDTAIATGDVVSAVYGAFTGGFASIPEAGVPSVVTVPAGAGVAMGAFELNPVTRGAMTAGNILATGSTLLTAASDVIAGETNVAISLGENRFSYSSSIGRDTYTSSVFCLAGWFSPIGITSAPLAAVPVANDLGILYDGPLSIIPQSIPIVSIDIGME